MVLCCQQQELKHVVRKVVSQTFRGCPSPHTEPKTNLYTSKGDFAG